MCSTAALPGATGLWVAGEGHALRGCPHLRHCCHCMDGLAVRGQGCCRARPRSAAAAARTGQRPAPDRPRAARSSGRACRSRGACRRRAACRPAALAGRPAGTRRRARARPPASARRSRRPPRRARPRRPGRARLDARAGARGARAPACRSGAPGGPRLLDALRPLPQQARGA